LKNGQFFFFLGGQFRGKLSKYSQLLIIRIIKLDVEKNSNYPVLQTKFKNHEKIWQKKMKMHEKIGEFDSSD